MWLGSYVAVTVVERSPCSSNLTPSPGTSTCPAGAALKTKKKKKKKEQNVFLLVKHDGCVNTD